MAKIVEDIFVIKFSKIVKDEETHMNVVSSDIQQTLEDIAQELVGNSIVVEVEKA